MKSVVETGRVIKRDEGGAKVMIDKGESCRGCGNAKIGLCKPGGSGMIMDVENPIGAEVGDTVKIGIDEKLRRRGYFLLYILPLFFLVFGSVLGYILNTILGISSLDVLFGFLFLALSLIYSLKKIHAYDRTRKLFIRTITEKHVGTH